MKSNILNIKKKFRKKQFDLRKKLFLKINKTFNKYLFEELFKIIDIDAINIISSFISINTEISTTELNEFILENNKILCMPVVLKETDHLIFRKFTNHEDLIEGYMNIKEPSNNNEILIPDLLFVPCLAFDRFGFRLGYGGGFYDKTFNYLNKNNNKFISVGFAYDGQEVNEVPKDKFDIKLDYVITEKKIYSYI